MSPSKEVCGVGWNGEGTVPLCTKDSNLSAKAAPSMLARFWATSQDASAVTTVTAWAFGPLASTFFTAEKDDDVGIEYQPGWTVGVPDTNRSSRNASPDETTPLAARSE